VTCLRLKKQEIKMKSGLVPPIHIEYYLFESVPEKETQNR